MFLPLLAAVGVSAAYLGWWRPLAGPLSPGEVDAYLDRVAATYGRGSDGSLFQARLRRFVGEDDGRPFVMANLIRDGVDACDAEQVYVSAWSRAAVARGCVPVYAGRVLGKLFGVNGQGRWDRVWLVRYRSRRDFLEVILDPRFAGKAHLKSAFVAETDVFAVSSGGREKLAAVVAALAVVVLARRALRRR